MSENTQPVNNQSSDDDYLSLLVIDDDELTLIEIVKIMRSLGISNIKTARNGQEGLEVIKSSAAVPSLILLDLRMPVMGGMELIQRLAELRYSSKIIIHSGADEEIIETINEMYSSPEYRLIGYLPKPLDPDQFIKLVMNKLTP